jgi:hypothetical protein
MMQNGGITPYYTTIINSTIDVCKYLNGTLGNPILKWLVNEVSDNLPKQYIHPCPFIGRVKVYNITFAGHIAGQFLRGRYKAVARSFDDQDDNIITLKIGTETG